jgi:UDP-N-acetylmuramate: L-alanyl-gamma-D-glutamyl-meso-diaminopimelate ligase
MKLGSMKAQLPWSLEDADLAFCSNAGLGWNVGDALAPMGERAVVTATFDEMVARLVAAARTGDHLLCMSNGGFGGIHAKLLDGIARRVQSGSLPAVDAPRARA